MFSPARIKKSEALLTKCRKRKLTIATAESCTGGLIAALLTEIPGSSDVFDRGFITYSNAAKTKQLGVSAALIKKHGAVSKEVAAAMAIGALKHSKAKLSVAVTGIAGPSGGTKTKPVGLVYIAVAYQRKIVIEQCHFKGNRNAVRMAALERAIDTLAAISAL